MPASAQTDTPVSGAYPPLPVALLDRIRPFLASCPDPGAPDIPCFSVNMEGVREVADLLSCSSREAMILCLGHNIWPLRFLRNRGTLTVGEQARLLGARAAVIGCGGLGGHVALLLARLGIGALAVCDHDSFDETNLNRQALCREDRLGQPKALVARDELALVASHVAVDAHVARLCAENLPDVLRGADIVVDCLDDFPVRREVEAAAHALGIPFVHGSLAGLEGFAMFCPPPESALKKLYGDRIAPGSARAEKEAGTPTPTPALTAVLEVALVLQYLVGKTPEAAGELLLWHADLSAPSLDVLRV